MQKLSEEEIHDPSNNDNNSENMRGFSKVIGELWNRLVSNLARHAVQAYPDLLPVLDIVDDGLIAPSAMRLCEENSRMTGPFSEEKESDMSKLVAGDDGRLEIQELDVDGQVLEASKKLDPTIRKAFLLAIEMHTCIVRALIFDRDRADPRATVKRLIPLQKLLVSFRRQVVQGIDKLLVPLMLAELNIINHILIQLLPAGAGQIFEVEGSPIPQKAVSFRFLDSDAAFGFNHDNPGIAGNRDSVEEVVKTTLSNQGHEQVICLNPGAPVTMKSDFDDDITTGSSDNHGVQLAEDDIDGESSLDLTDAFNAVSEAASSEFSFEIIEIAEPNAFKA